MSEQELVFNVKELHVISLTCSECGHGTIFDFKSSDYLEKSVSPVCSICKTELMIDLQQQLKSYRCFYDSMSRCERVEFRVRLQTPEVALSATAAETAMAVSAAAEESAIKVQEMVSTAVAEVQQVAIAAAATTIESTTEVQHMVSTALAQVHEMTSTAVTQVQAAVVKILAREQDVSKFGEPSFWARKHGTEFQQK